jgi:phosphoglycerol transferase
MTGTLQHAEVRVDTPATRRPTTSRSLLKASLERLGEIAVVAVATFVPLSIVYRFWDGNFRIPLAYWGDANFYGGVTQNIIDTGWYQTSDRLGAPFGQEMYDFALGGDNLHWLMIRILTIPSQDWALVNNLFAFLSFFTIALASFYALRWMRVGRTLAVSVAVLYAFAPFHFIRANGHLVYASYVAVPVGVVLALRAARGLHPFSRFAAGAGRTWARTGIWLAAVVVVASCGSYYTAFSVLLVVTACVLACAANRSREPLAAMLVVVALVGAVYVANQLPSILYSREHGDNAQVAERQPAEVDAWGLRVVQLVTPIPEHRIAPLASLSAELLQGGLNSEVSMFLGTIGTIALLGMLGWMLVNVVSNRRGPPGAGRDDIDERQLLPALALVCILVGVQGGLAWFVAIAGGAELRSWNRISIVIAFLALAWLALTIERHLVPRIHTARGAAILGLSVALVVALGIADQTSDEIVSDRRTQAPAFHADRAYFTELEQRLPPGAAIYQLPYVPYPESGPVFNIVDYDPIRPYLHTRELRWSYGAMRGREGAERLRAISEQPTPRLVEDVRAEGFAGILVDTYGYEDAREILAGLEAETGRRGVASDDGRWVLFELP